MICPKCGYSESNHVVTKSDKTSETFHLNRPHYGLHIPPQNWRHMENFSTNSLGLHISSEIFNEEDYIKDFSTYLSCL
jgi:hypothetical protein